MQGQFAHFQTWSVVLHCKSFSEESRQPGNILLPLTKRRQIKLDVVDPVEQVLPEPALLTQLIEIGVGGTYQPHIHRNWLGGSHPGHLSPLNHRKKLGLERQRQIAYLVQEKRSARGDLYPSGFLLQRIGKCPLHMSKQLTFKNILRDGTHINAHKNLPTTHRFAVNITCKHLLPRTVFTQDQNVGIGGSHLFDCIHHIRHFWSGAPAKIKIPVGMIDQVLLLRLQVTDLQPGPPQLVGRKNGGEDLLPVPRF